MNAKFKNLISTVFPLIGIAIITVLINKDILQFFNTSILYISGIPLLEKAADANWGTSSSYKNYRRNTSILIPFPPKKSN